jgi:hypothetical protein
MSTLRIQRHTVDPTAAKGRSVVLWLARSSGVSVDGASAGAAAAEQCAAGEVRGSWRGPPDAGRQAAAEQALEPHTGSRLVGSASDAPMSVA